MLKYESKLRNVYVYLSRNNIENENITGNTQHENIILNNVKEDMQHQKHNCNNRNRENPEYEKLKKIIISNMNGKHKIIFDNMSDYDDTKDILISDGISSLCKINTDINTNKNIILQIDKDIKDNNITDKSLPTLEMKLNNKELCEDIGVGKEYRGKAPYVIYNIDDITPEYCEHIYARKTHTPAFILETPNYIVREECEDDLPELYKLYETLSECPYVEPLYEISKEREFLNNYINNMYNFFDYGMWLVYSKDTGKLVGRMGIENRSIDGANCQELGYIVGKKYQGHGIAYEVCTAIIEYAYEYLGIDSLYACIHKENIASVNLIKKLGFELYAQDADGMDIYYMPLSLI